MPETDVAVVLAHGACTGNQRFMAERIKARVHAVPTDHAPMVTAPHTVTGILMDAVREVQAHRLGGKENADV
jgi:hypothetical protein